MPSLLVPRPMRDRRPIFALDVALEVALEVAADADADPVRRPPASALAVATTSARIAASALMAPAAGTRASRPP